MKEREVETNHGTYTIDEDAFREHMPPELHYLINDPDALQQALERQMDLITGHSQRHEPDS